MVLYEVRHRETGTTKEVEASSARAACAAMDWPLDACDVRRLAQDAGVRESGKPSWGRDPDDEGLAGERTGRANTASWTDHS